jgi:Tfp pilus assembly protein PilF
LSLIDEALKAAQREKSRLDAESGRSSAPILVRLRTQPRQNTERTPVLIASGAIVTILAALLWFWSTREDSLPDIPPVTSAILTEAIVSDSVRLQGGAFASRPELPAVDTARAASAPADPSLDLFAGRPSAANATDAVAPDVALVRAGSEDQRAAAVQHAEPPTARPGTLRISVEEPRPSSAGELFSEAIAAHRAQDHARARGLYERVLAITPNDGDALNNLGVILSMDGDYDRAYVLLRRAVVVAPRNAGAWNNIGNLLREKGERDESIAAFQRALAIDAEHQGARVGLAQQYLAVNALPQARQLLEDVLRANPALPEAHYTLGQVLELQGERAAAVIAYGAFIRFAPQRLAAHVELVRRRVDLLSAAP